MDATHCEVRENENHPWHSKKWQPGKLFEFKGVSHMASLSRLVWGLFTVLIKGTVLKWFMYTHLSALLKNVSSQR